MSTTAAAMNQEPTVPSKLENVGAMVTRTEPARTWCR